MSGRIENDQFERNFVSATLVRWKGRREEAFALPIDFEEQMSPRQLFHKEPLSHCDGEPQIWLGDLVHHLWLARYPVQEWIRQASEQAQEANEAYEQLQEALGECDDVRSAEALRPFRDEFAAFRDRDAQDGSAVEEGSL